MDISKKTFIDHLTRARGVITKAAKSAKIARSTVYNWLNEDQEFKNAVIDIQEVALDFAEDKLFNLINKGDTAATIFYLKTKGKVRGYTEREDDNKPPVIVAVNVSKEEAKEIAAAIKGDI